MNTCYDCLWLGEGENREGGKVRHYLFCIEEDSEREEVTLTTPACKYFADQRIHLVNPRLPMPEEGE